MAQMITSFKDIFERARSKPAKRVVLAAAEDPSALAAVVESRKMGLTEGILVGDESRIRFLLDEKLGDDISYYECVNELDPEKSAQIAARMAGEGKADILLKGKMTTSMLLKAVLAPESHLRDTELLSDVVMFEDPRPGENHLTLVSDGGVNIQPDISQKAQIIRNAVKVAHALGMVEPRVAVLSAAEYVIPAMQSSVDALALKEMNETGEISGCFVDGPFGLDNAISVRDATFKDVTSPIAGKADILIMPNIETGNIFGKGLVYYNDIMIVHVIVGAKVPVLICSRVDPPKAKLTSLALAVALLS